jgi:hypothetical protein
MSERSVTLEQGNFESRIRKAPAAAMDCLRRYEATARVVGSTAVAAVLTIAVLYGPHTMSERQLEATVKMERITAKLERARQIPPKTASEIARMIDRPEFDCARVSCRPSLEPRNKTARARLEALLKAQAFSNVSRF